MLAENKSSTAAEFRKYYYLEANMEILLGTIIEIGQTKTAEVVTEDDP